MTGDALVSGVAPGPALSARLAGLDLPLLPDAVAVDVLRASWRQVSHAYAQYLVAMAEVGRRCEPAWAACEIAAALTFTGRRADYEHTFARTVVERLPLVLDALRTGEIDHHKARVFADHLAELTDDQIALICGRLVPRAPGWTTGQLAARLLREVLAVDHRHARKRYQRAVRERGVSGFLAPDGTVTITAHGLIPSEAAAAADRLDELAAAVRRAGHPGTVHQIRADLFVRLLDGRYNGFTTDQIVAAMLAEASGDSVHESSSDTGHADRGGSDRVGSGGSGSDAGESDTGAGLQGHRDEGGTGTESSGSAQVPAEGVRHGVEVRIGLATLLGLDDHPAELPGWGPILAEDARMLVSRQHAAEWCFAITDAEGYLLQGGAVSTRTNGRIRPRTASTGVCRGGVVEIHIAGSRLAELAGSPDVPPEWAAFVADLARRHAAWRARPGDRDACLDERPLSRLPHHGLRRHVRLRDRTCVAPGCRRPARKADQDHTHDHARGGATVRANLGPLCERHHLMKHEGGWTLAQPEPGRFVWCSPLRQTYRTRGDPIAPDLPAPVPRDDEDDEDDEDHVGRTHDGPTLPRGPGVPLPPPRAGPPSAPDDGPPPF